MKKITAQNKVICQNENSMYNYFGWPTVGRLPNGALAMVCSGLRTAHIDPFGKGVICYSFDEGQTWTRPAIVFDTPEDDRDCGITTFGNKVMINTFNNGVDYQLGLINPTPLMKAYCESIDTKKADEDYYGPLYVISDNGYSFGEIKHLPVQNPHGFAPMPDGTIFLVGNRFSQTERFPDLYCYLMDDSENFTLLSTIKNPEGMRYCEAHAIALEDRIIVMIREESTFRIRQHVSYDGGKTWDEGRYIETAKGAPPHIIRHSNGTLICAYGRRQEPFGEMVMFSSDNGDNWDTEYFLRDDGPDGDLGYPATVELKDGSLMTVYYQKEAGSDHCVIMQSIWQLPEKYQK